MEIERKFLLKSIPADINQAPSDWILQGYIALDPNGSEVRVRNKGDKYFLTAKSGGQLERTEAEIEISKGEFERLWPLTDGRRVEKKRHTVQIENKLLIEVDQYHGALEGLLTAEVEFPTLDACRNFVVPVWFGEEVTSDPRYKNKNLACAGLPL
jgi:CYTH domain-containing protein